MKTQEPPTSAHRSQWIVPAAAVAGIAVLAFVLLRPDPSRQSAPTPEPEASSAPGVPRFTNPGRPPEEPAAPPAIAARPRPLPPACGACEEKNRGSVCMKEMGCQGLAGDDKKLCEELLTCLRAHPDCYTKNPALCYCGAAQGMECVNAPKGPCIQQALAATKTTDLTESARRFFIPDFPSGRASQVAACDVRACKQECGASPNTGG